MYILSNLQIIQTIYLLLKKNKIEMNEHLVIQRVIQSKNKYQKVGHLSLKIVQIKTGI
jgi:hypothetical protein